MHHAVPVHQLELAFYRVSVISQIFCFMSCSNKPNSSTFMCKLLLCICFCCLTSPGFLARLSTVFALFHYVPSYWSLGVLFLMWFLLIFLYLWYILTDFILLSLYQKKVMIVELFHQFPFFFPMHHIPVKYSSLKSFLLIVVDFVLGKSQSKDSEGAIP